MSQVTTPSGVTDDGTGTANEVTIWASADSLKGDAGLTYSGSKLSLSNRLDIGDVGAAGVIENTNTNENILMEVNGTGIVEVENQTVNNPTTLQIRGNGSGKPSLVLTNDAEACTIEVTTNNELTVQGSLNDFKFDVSSATGGITFPDGTEQITAASGGGGPSPGALQSVQCIWAGQTNPWVCVNEANLGWDDGLTMTSSNHCGVWTNQADGGFVTYYPIFFPQDLTIDYTGVITAEVTGGTINFDIFASDSDNFPTGAGLLSWTTVTSSSAYAHVETSVSATSFSKGLHFLAVSASAAGTFLLGNFAAGPIPTNSTASGYKYGPAVTPFCNYSSVADSITALANQDFSYYLSESATNTIPGTINLSNIELGGRDRDGQFHKGMVVPSLFVRRST